MAEPVEYRNERGDVRWQPKDSRGQSLWITGPDAILLTPERKWRTAEQVARDHPRWEPVLYRSQKKAERKGEVRDALAANYREQRFRPLRIAAGEQTEGDNR